MAKKKKKTKKPVKRRTAKRAKRAGLSARREKAAGPDPKLVAALGRTPLGKCFANEGWKEAGRSVSVCVSRALASGRFVIGLFWVDPACVGVRGFTIEEVSRTRFEATLSDIDPPLFPCSAELAAKIVTRSAAYGIANGIEPPPYYAAVESIFEGVDVDQCDVEFELGVQGMPFFIPMPGDDRASIIAAMTDRLGADGFRVFDPLSL